MQLHRSCILGLETKTNVLGVAFKVSFHRKWACIYASMYYVYMYIWDYGCMSAIM